MRSQWQRGSEKEGAVRRQRLLPVTPQQHALPLGQIGDERAGQWGAADFAAAAARTDAAQPVAHAQSGAGIASAWALGHSLSAAFLWHPSCGLGGGTPRSRPGSAWPPGAPRPLRTGGVAHRRERVARPGPGRLGVRSPAARASCGLTELQPALGLLGFFLE